MTLTIVWLCTEGESKSLANKEAATSNLNFSPGKTQPSKALFCQLPRKTFAKSRFQMLCSVQDMSH